MAIDDDWVADVKRWCLAQREGSAAERAESDDPLGDEAAHPALEARHWPDAVELPLYAQSVPLAPR